MQKERFIIIPNKKDLTKYNKFSNFILPLKDYSIGFDVYFDMDEINELSFKYNIYVIMNKFLHRKVDEFKKIYSKFNNNIKFIVEDIGLTDVIDKNRIILFENHIYSNYKAINYLKELGFNKLVINNDLTISEIKDILSNTDSELFYYYINRNDIMYSRRNLVSNYNKYFNLEETDKYVIEEKVSKEKLIIKEENGGSVVKYSKLFCASKYINDLEKLNLIINFTTIDEKEEDVILDNYDNSNLINMISCDYYFLENDIKYKVGDLK